MSRIFMSYSYSDKELVTPIVHELEKMGHEIYSNVEIMPTGVELKDVISQGIKHADFVIPILTEISIDSQWVNYEVSTAAGYQKEKGKPIILPIVFDNVSVPGFFHPIKVIEVSRNDYKSSINRVISAVQYAIGKEMAVQEEKNEVIESVKQNTAEYIRDTLFKLEKAERNYKRIAYSCYITSLLFLIGSLYYLFIRKSNLIITSDKLIEQFSSIVFSLVLLSLIIAVSRFFFSMGKSFMVESLRNSDRIHAISFGKFYLNVYGQKVEWTEIKEAFQHWNIDTGSTFKNQSSNEYDPEIIKHFTSLVNAIKK